jgi:hypothetical protein
LALTKCEMLVAVLDGAHIDEGVAFELGFAHARGCLCLGLQSDTRRALPSGNNPMIGRALSSIFTSTRDLTSCISFEHALRTGGSHAQPNCSLPSENERPCCWPTALDNHEIRVHQTVCRSVTEQEFDQAD